MNVYLSIASNFINNEVISIQVHYFHVRVFHRLIAPLFLAVYYHSKLCRWMVCNAIYKLYIYVLLDNL